MESTAVIQKFRTALGGFNRQDVQQYIEQTAAAHRQELAELQLRLDEAEDRAAQLENSLLAWEDVLSICQTVQGISGPMESRQNIRCMQMFTGAFMYAAGSHIGIG